MNESDEHDRREWACRGRPVCKECAGNERRAPSFISEIDQGRYHPPLVANKRLFAEQMVIAYKNLFSPGRAIVIVPRHMLHQRGPSRAST